MPGLRWDGTMEEVMAATAQQNENQTMDNKISATLSDADKAAALGFFQSLIGIERRFRI